MVRKTLVVIVLALSLIPVAIFAQVTPPVSTPEVTPQPTNQLKIEGMVESLQNGVLVIGDQTIDVSNAVIQRGVVVGGFAEAYVTFTADGVWVASEVELDRNVDADDLNEVEIEGIVTEIGTDFVVIGGRTFDISVAEIRGNIVVGALVDLELEFRGGRWVADDLRLDDHSDDRDDNSGPGNRDDDHNNSGRGSRDDDHDDREDNSGPDGGGDDDD